jgi:hypothetical protein
MVNVTELAGAATVGAAITAEENRENTVTRTTIIVVARRILIFNIVPSMWVEIYNLSYQLANLLLRTASS